MFAVDVQVQDYRRLKYVVLNFTKTDGTATPPEGRVDYGFHNAYAARIGWQRPLKKFTARAGWAFDGTPVPEHAVSPLWPDSTRLNFSAGASKQMQGREFSFFYQFTKFLPRTTNVAANANVYTNGDWKSTAQTWGFQMRLHKGGGDLEFTQ